MVQRKTAVGERASGEGGKRRGTDGGLLAAARLAGRHRGDIMSRETEPLMSRITGKDTDLNGYWSHFSVTAVWCSSDTQETCREGRISFFVGTDLWFSLTATFGTGFGFLCGNTSCLPFGERG